MFRRLVPLFVLAMAAYWLTAVPALAVGTGSPSIVAPAANSAVASGFRGPVTIDFSEAQVDTYEVYVECPATDYWWATTYSYTGSQDVKSWTVPAIAGPVNGCSVSVYGTESFADTSFHVAAPPTPPLVLDGVRQTQGTFYPRVHDGYRDFTRTGFRTNVKADIQVAVTAHDGRVVRHAHLGTLRAGIHTWQWNGARSSGTKVAAGRYRIRLTATAAQTRHASTTAVVATSWRTKSHSITREGWNYSSGTTLGNCFISEGFDSVTEELDCWGGKQSVLRYRFAIPANATHVRWAVTGHRAFDDFCCRGVIKKSGKRIGRTHVRIEVKVTGWRAYDVRYAEVFYRYRARI